MVTSTFWPKIDYVLGIDPGYGTQGIAAITLTGEILEYESSVTTSSIDLHSRCMYQISRILKIINHYGTNCLLVIEEFHAGMSSKASAESIYRRGWYDGMIRHYIMPRVKLAITVHNSKVHQWSEDSRVWVEKRDKKGAVKLAKSGKPLKKWKKPTETQIRNYILSRHPWLNSSSGQLDIAWSRALLRGLNPYGKKDQLESESKSVMHATDALVMAVMGHVAYVDKKIPPRLTVKQLDWLRKVREENEYQRPETEAR